jgi:3-deoxy-D-manno-octulosonic-acid transferase
MGILLDLVYLIGLVLISPIWLYRMIRYGRYRSDTGQRLGATPIRYGLQPVIWVHGVSLGEVNACRMLVAELHSQLPDYRVVLSTTTDTGMEAARKLFAADHTVFRWPLDFSLAVRRALGRVRPDLVVMMEGEVWPNFLAACNARGIPAVVVNGRMSADKGYPRYRMMGPLAGRLFNRLAAIGVQDEAYAERFVSLGTKAEKVHVTGMMKFDTAQPADRIAGQEALAAAMGIAPADRLLVAGGTGPGEEQILLDVFEHLRQRHPAAKLALVPRKPERFDEVARLIESRGLTCIRRSRQADGAPPPPPPPAGGSTGSPPSGSTGSPQAILLGDTMGELRKFYALGAAVFVGRSLVPMGGSDMIESAALGRPTAFGPHTFNFPQADHLAAHGCARVADAGELERQFDAWLSNDKAAAEAGAAAQRYVRSQQGATRRNVEMICRVLHRIPAAEPGQIATDEI